MKADRLLEHASISAMINIKSRAACRARWDSTFADPVADLLVHFRKPLKDSRYLSTRNRGEAEEDQDSAPADPSMDGASAIAIYADAAYGKEKILEKQKRFSTHSVQPVR
ncbi:MAG: hypothetical protein ACYCTW_03850 [Sulfuricella sp.]